MSDFLPAFEFLLPHEGGLANNPHDPGWLTKFGISQRSYPDVNIAALTIADAEAIYRRDWWEKYGYARIDDQDIANKVFDLSVNMGASRAHKILQEACNRCGSNIKEDGGLGPITITAVNSRDPVPLMIWMRSLAQDFYRALAEEKPQLQVFLHGWLERASA